MLHKNHPTFPLGDFYLARASANLSEQLAQQAQRVYDLVDLKIPVAATSTFDLIADQGPMSIADVSRALGRSHQSVSQQVKTLLKLGLLEGRDSEADARARLYELNTEGRAQHDLLTLVKAPIAQAYRGLFEEIGVDLSKVLELATLALADKPLQARIERP